MSRNGNQGTQDKCPWTLLPLQKETENRALQDISVGEMTEASETPRAPEASPALLPPEPNIHGGSEYHLRKPMANTTHVGRRESRKREQRM